MDPSVKVLLLAVSVCAVAMIIGVSLGASGKPKLVWYGRAIVALVVVACITSLVLYMTSRT
jgi:hypothetical protein